MSSAAAPEGRRRATESGAVAFPLRKVAKLQFGVVDPNELRQRSVTQATTTRAGRNVPDGITRYETIVNGRPVCGGLNDPRLMGSLASSGPGCFGHMVLARPVYHPLLIGATLKVLRCVCFHCGRLRTTTSSSSATPSPPPSPSNNNEEEAKVQACARIESRKERLQALHELLRRNTESCAHCQSAQPKFTRTTDFRIRADVVPDGTPSPEFLSGAAAVECLGKIRDSDLPLLGLDGKQARPEWLLVSVLPVPPVHVRPHIRHDLTVLLQDAVKANLSLERATANSEPRIVVEQLESKLQSSVAALFVNGRRGPGPTHCSPGRPIRSIVQRLEGSEGRLRNHLLRKRVHFCARAVVTPDPNLGIEQVGIPRSIAMNLTIPARVTTYNKRELSPLVANGPLVYPGANHVIRNDGSSIDLRSVKDRSEISLDPGWIVERHLLDGDVVVMNQHPCRGKKDIAGHRVKVLDWSTFRLNPFHARGCDDETDLHLPRSLSARAEAEFLMLSPCGIISEQSNRPVKGLVQDSLLAVHLMTRRSVFIEKDLCFAMLMAAGDHWNMRVPGPAILKPKELWTGKQLMSMVLPKVNLKDRNRAIMYGAWDSRGIPLPNTFNFRDNVVTIQEGELLEGAIDRKTLHGMGGLLHTIWLDLGREEAARFINQVQQLVNHWILQHSFSIGVCDAVVDHGTIHQIDSTIDKAKRQVQDLVHQGQLGELEIQRGRTMIESFEQLVNHVLNRVRDRSGYLAQLSLDESNSIKAMVQSINITQIIACIGQQKVEGNRIPYGFRKRTLPHFCKDDIGSESRGFVENSYLRGLSPQEFFFHAMGGRDGLIDKANRTVESGHIQHSLVRAMDLVITCYDGTLRTSEGQVVQFLYGEDGIDATWIERQDFISLTLTRTEFDKRYLLDTFVPDFGHDDSGIPFLEPGIIEDCRREPEVQLMMDRELENLRQDQLVLRTVMKHREAGRESDESSYAPGNIKRVISKAIYLFRIDKNKPSGLHPRDVIKSVNALVDRLTVVAGDDPLSVETQRNATTLYRILIRSMLASKCVLSEYRLSKDALDWVQAEIEKRFDAAKVNPGEMVGSLVANAFTDLPFAPPMGLLALYILAGVSEKKVTRGLPRLKELLSATKTTKTPIMSIYLQKEVSGDKEVAELVVLMLETTVLGDLVRKTEIYYDPDVKNSVVPQDREFVKYFYDFAEKPDEDLGCLSPWVLRIELDKVLVYVKKIKMAEILTEIGNGYGNDLNVEVSDDNADNLVIRVRVVGGVQADSPMTDESTQSVNVEEAKGRQDHDFCCLKHLCKCLLSFVKLRGLDNVKKVFMRGGAKLTVWDDNTGFVTQDEWLLETDGTNLMGVLGLDYVDASRTTSNDIGEVNAALGIEAARSALLTELRNVISFDGSYVNYRHYACLVDVMTVQGILMSIDQVICSEKNGPLYRASLQGSVEPLVDSSICCQEDTFKEPTISVVMGQLPRVGTGYFDVMNSLDSQCK